MTEKDKKIIEDAERENIPIFVFTAKDVLSFNMLVIYRDACEACSKEHCQQIEERIDEFYLWQKNNPDKVKLPD